MSNKSKNTIKETLSEAVVTQREQPYEIPENWNWVKFGNVAKLYNGYAFKSTDYQETGIPVIRISDITGVNTTSKKAVKVPNELYNERFLIKKGDLLIAMSGATTGKTGVYNSNEIALQNQRVGNIKELNTQLLYSLYKNYFVFNNSNEILRKAYGGAQPNISAALIEQLDFPLPPLEEQKRIAEKIDRLLSKIEEAKQLIEEAKETFELRRAAILHKAFRGELTKKWREFNGENGDSLEYIQELKANNSFKGNGVITEPYCLPNGWRWAKLGELFHVQVGSTPSRKREEYWRGSFPWLSSGEVQFNKINNSRESVTELAVKECRLKLSPKGSILFGMIGEGKTRGQVALLNLDAYHNQNIASIWVSETKISSVYVYYWLLSQYMNNRQNSAGNNQPAYNKNRVQELLIPIAPLSEINIVVIHLQKLLEVEEEIYDLLNIQEKISDLKQSILMKAFRGELGTNDPTEETAIELLKQVIEEKL
ncbi:restriction endonuclease subunit S [Anaerobacillus sp. CMMVII]|uniref:restriction endonuclease subunit S n=1 Tax=Anaerobacillus sp. CMMVII TaxID=2755588 RepID=UPI0021B7F88D|nr:restriction endonuclease subunit S [Anaerobacillus sp. CMMVII]MCT8137891.1 restriction endonuclease subunit S [Anaerobacillus sp. CMMVII]